jgi:hypothetical protein
MSELLVALAMAAALGAKPAPTHPDPQARSRPPATVAKAQVAAASHQAPPKPHDARRAGAL